MSQSEDTDASMTPVRAYKQLKAALEAGELDLAVRCYAIVNECAPPASGSPDAVSAAFDEVGVVLSQGDLGKAQVAFEVFESFLKAAELAQSDRRDALEDATSAPRKVNIVG